jgi:hypothetical protein
MDRHFGGKFRVDLFVQLLLILFQVHAIYQNLGIPCEVHQFSDSKTTYAEENLLDWVQEYFEAAAVPDGKKVQCTLKPPIYFQRPGHSLTIVGLEIMRDGTRNLLVFDPMYQAPRLMKQMVDAGHNRIVGPNFKLLNFYRRSQYRLQNYVDFETLEYVLRTIFSSTLLMFSRLTGDLPMFPAWEAGRHHR